MKLELVRLLEARARIEGDSSAIVGAHDNLRAGSTPISCLVDETVHEQGSRSVSTRCGVNRDREQLCGSGPGLVATSVTKGLKCPWPGSNKTRSRSERCDQPVAQ